MDKPVSIVIPCYDHGVYLRDAIASVEKCDRGLFEVIIVNDGSTDPQTLAILKELARTYVVIDQENAGLGAARNAGIKRAKGKYILPLDADNMIFPRYLSTGARLLEENPGLAVVYGNRELFGEIRSISRVEPGPFDRGRLVAGNYIDACAIIRKQAIEDCGWFATDMPVQGHEDWDLWLTMLEAGWGFHFVDEIMFRYRVRNDAMTQEMSRVENRAKVLEYVSHKHAVLIHSILEQQHDELRKRRSWLPYLLWPLAKKIYRSVKPNRSGDQV